MMATTGNNGHQPGAINPTGEIIRVMTQHESSEDEVQKKTMTHKDKSTSKIHVPRLSFEGGHWNRYISQFELVAKTLACVSNMLSLTRQVPQLNLIPLPHQRSLWPRCYKPGAIHLEEMVVTTKRSFTKSSRLYTKC